jgi:hypothetical protein
MLISRENYSIIMTDEYDPNSFKDWTNEPFPIVLVDRLSVPFKEPDRLFSMVGTYWASKPIIDEKGNKNQKNPLNPQVQPNKPGSENNQQPAPNVQSKVSKPAKNQNASGNSELLEMDFAA